MKRQSRLNPAKSLVVLLIMVISAVMFVWIYFASDVADIRFNNEPLKSLDGTFSVTYLSDSEEVTIETELPARLELAKAGNRITVNHTLSKSEINGRYLAFYRQQSWVDVYLGGEQLIKADRAPDLPFPMSAGSRWYIFRLPDDFDGKELRIEMTAQFDEYAPVLPEIFSGSKSSIIYMIVHDARFSILTGLPTIILGITCIIFGTLLRKKKSDGRMILLGMLAVTISVWYLLESRITQVLFGNIALCSFVLFTCYNLIPLILTALLLTFETFSKHKYTHVLFRLSAASFLIVQILQVTGAAYYIDLVFVVHILLILIISDIIICFIREKKSSKPTNEMYIYKALLIFAGFALVDLAGFYFCPAFMVGTASKMGLLFFIAYLIYTVFRQFYETEIYIAKNEVYRELAVKDLMTGLGNRTAFEQEMSVLRENSEQTEPVYFLFADVNNLKSINDTYGHTNGDECLINTAQILMKCFAEPSVCCRIGGDEFCVICRGIADDKEMDARVEQMHSLVKLKDEKTEYPYAIACGYHVIDEDGADSCLKKADAIMYKDKSKYKITK